MDTKEILLLEIVLGTLGRLMKGGIASINSFLPIMLLSFFGALRYKILWFFIPITGLLAPIPMDLIALDGWHGHFPSGSLRGYLHQERMEIISLHLASVISSLALCLWCKSILKRIHHADGNRQTSE
ncbi:MAG: hypothetical protein LUE13_00145 [Akkermansiaceae bacterium]|nr:hypothetical protein [Akkermansiaceae bacterium]